MGQKKSCTICQGEVQSSPSEAELHWHRLGNDWSDLDRAWALWWLSQLLHP